jgi:putative hydrolase of the HAD superfamily
VPPVSLVLFDMDNVLCDYDRAARIARLSSLSGRSPREIEAAIWDSGFEALGDAGAISAESYLRGFGERIGHALTLEEWLAARQASMAPAREVLDLVRLLKARARVAVLTNNTTIIRDRIDHLLPELRPLFGEAVFASAQFGVAKPDPEVYRLCLQELGASPAETLFVDDLPENVAGAEAAGLRGHHFTAARRLAAALERHGLL